MVCNHKKYELPQNPAVDHTFPKIDIKLRKSPSFLDKAMWTPRVYIAAMFGKNNFNSIDINPNHNSRVLRAICVKVWGILPQHHQVHCHCCMASDTQRSVLWKCCDKYQYINPIVQTSCCWFTLHYAPIHVFIPCQLMGLLILLTRPDNIARPQLHLPAAASFLCRCYDTFKTSCNGQ